MFVIVEMARGGGIHGVFGPFKSLSDPKLKGALVEKGLIAKCEDPDVNEWYAKPQGIGAMVCEVDSSTSSML